MRIAPLVLVPLLAAGLTAPALAAGSPQVTKAATLPDIPLGAFQNAELPDSVSDDRGVLLGGIGSGLFPLGGNEYWTVTDRGPNGEIGDDRTFIVPEFTPTLVRVKVQDPSMKVLEAIPITTPEGEPVTGLPNLPIAGDPPPKSADAVTFLDYNPNGLDTEGVVRTPDGHFWLVDEYGPSIVETDADGHVVTRHVPAGLEDDYEAAGVDYPVTGSLPAILSTRRANRGFEDIALLPDGTTIVVALQSSVVVSGERDRIITELIEFDTTTGTVVHRYPYRFDAASTFATGTRGRDLKISALIPIDQTHVVVQERTDFECRFYLVELDKTDALITEDDKTLLVNLAGVAGVPNKVEGAALKNGSTLIVISDNDFGFVPRAYADGEDVDYSGVKTVLAEVKIP
ncbi:MAG TPA: esterase-like activity of phytase family protein [Nocardioidaceae bacterium]|nr:esterase-like activity of phytase family protein [Nocardioidaceae bacterium]